MVDPDAIEVGDFVRAPSSTDAASLAAGIYRVVGKPPGVLVLLRVSDADGDRANTGEVVRMAADEADVLEPSSEPRPTPTAILKNLVQGPYWLVRSLLPF